MYQPALYERQLSVELEAVRSHAALRQAEQAEIVLGEETLIGEVVDGEDRPRVRLGVHPQVAAAEGGMPVMCVQDVRTPCWIEVPGGEMGCCPAE